MIFRIIDKFNYGMDDLALQIGAEPSLDASEEDRMSDTAMIASPSMVSPDAVSTGAGGDLAAESRVRTGHDNGVDLTAFLWPKSIAIVGANADVDSIRGRILGYLLQREYSGALYLVSSTQPEVRGRKTYASLRDIPGTVDLVLIAVRAEATYAILEECAAIGARFAICYSSGFAESGAAGVVLQKRIAQFVGRGGTRVCGPNTAGYFNIKGGIPATFARNVDLRRAACVSCRSGAGTVTVVAQSGGLGFALSDRCSVEHGLRVNYVMGTGNEVDLEALDFVDYAVGDESTRVILLLIESIKHPKRLADVAERAKRAGKPIVAAKFGRTDAGSRAVDSHAGRLTGSDAVYNASLRRHGLIRVDDEDEMTDLAAAFSFCPPPAGRRVGILTTSGGAGVWMADACESAGLRVPLLDDSTQLALTAHVPSYGAIQNPVDLTAQVTVNPATGVDGPSALVGALEALLDSPSIDSVVLIANMSDGALLAREQHALAELVPRLKKPLLLYSHAPPSRASAELVQKLGLICLSSTRRVAQTLASMATWSETLASLSDVESGPPPLLAKEDRSLLESGLIEYQAKALFVRHGIAVTKERLVRSADAAVVAALDFGTRVALKIQSRQIPHKTEMGGVMLGVQGALEVRAAYALLLERARARMPTATIDGILVQEMSPPALELALGVVQDPDFGPVMLVGMGGIYVEIFNDVVIETLPIRRDRALTMLQRLRTWPVLAGARGKAKADVNAVAEMMEKLSLLVEASAGACGEIDLNPVFVYDEGQGAIVVDALVVGRDELQADIRNNL
jgi:acyl-CoA synthetase (NDP forming)